MTFEIVDILSFESKKIFYTICFKIKIVCQHLNNFLVTRPSLNHNLEYITTHTIESNAVYNAIYNNLAAIHQ